MPLASGTRLGPYEIQSAIGAGGMGEVYKARDTRLDRTVAIKVLPAEVASDHERRVRFEREAKTVAALSHPHICPLFDVGVHKGAMFLVMEHLTGETLAERLRKGPLPLDQALGIATQIAEGLAAAHRHGVIHRDLKPGNVMLTKSGGASTGSPQAKLLDFGLAKLRATGTPLALSITMSVPTQEPATSVGTILGTVPYMAPEQLEGKDADSRTDIFAFGAVLYEMLTGKRAFEGASHASLIAAILEHEPAPLSSIQPVTPPALDRFVAKCLRKDPDARWQTAADVADELQWLASGSASMSFAVPTAPRSSRRRQAIAVLALLLAIGSVAAGIAAWRARPGAPAVATRSFLAIPVSASNLRLAGDGLALSPDGHSVAFVGARPGERPMLFVRRLGEKEPQALSGTEGAMKPFFSPDGQKVAYYIGGQIMRVAVHGGTPQPVITDPEWVAGEIQFGGVWAANNRVIFGGGYIRPGIWEVSADGGRPELLVKGDASTFYNFPDVLPDDKGVVFTIARGGRSSIYASSRAGPARELIKNASRARYLPTGHLVYEEGGSLRMVRFDPDSLRAEGDPLVVVEDVGTAWLTATWDISPAGTFAYMPSWVGHRRLVWRDRSGRRTSLPLTERSYIGMALSPDNQRIVVGIAEGLRRSLWSGPVDAEPLQPLTYGYDDIFQTFSPDGLWVAFTRHERGQYNIWRTRADGSGAVEQVTDGNRPEGLPAYSPDGRTLLFNSPEATGDYHIWQKPVEPAGPASPFIRTPSVHAETHAAFSRDGRWVAYLSDAGARGLEVWVKQYPNGERRQVSSGGGANPVWNPAANELFYLGSAGLMSVRFSNGRAEPPVALFPASASDAVYQLAVSRDGQRFLLFESVESATQPSLIYIVSNCLEPLKDKLASRR